MKDSFILALLILAALILIPLVALGGGNNAEVKNPFDTASKLENTSASAESTEPVMQTIDPNGDAKAALDELLAQADIAAPPKAADDTPAEQAPAPSKHDEPFKILSLSTGKVDTVSVRDYVIGAVASEMPASFNEEALKAQAVAAHTYALRLKYNQEISPDEALGGADFSADPQKYLGYMTEEIAKKRFGGNFDIYWSKVTEAADSVLSQILVYDDEPIVAAYHSMCAGQTESAETVWGKPVSYLVPVESFGDTLAKNYEVSTEFQSADVKAKLLAEYPDIKLSATKSKWFAVKSRTDSGTITELVVGNKTITGQEARAIFELRSADFTVKYSGGIFTFVTTGYGHGVGLSQYGADYMGRQGSTYDEILLHYYPGAELTDVSKLA